VTLGRRPEGVFDLMPGRLADRRLGIHQHADLVAAPHDAGQRSQVQTDRVVVAGPQSREVGVQSGRISIAQIGDQGVAALHQRHAVEQQIGTIDTQLAEAETHAQGVDDTSIPGQLQVEVLEDRIMRPPQPWLRPGILQAHLDAAPCRHLDGARSTGDSVGDRAG
jgi:hypothetical protein